MGDKAFLVRRRVIMACPCTSPAGAWTVNKSKAETGYASLIPFPLLFESVGGVRGYRVRTRHHFLRRVLGSSKDADEGTVSTGRVLLGGGGDVQPERSEELLWLAVRLEGDGCSDWA